MNPTKYFGVYIAKESDTTGHGDSDNLHVYTSYEEALKLIKEFKTSRFKSFTTEEEAKSFSLHGSASGPGNPNVVSESIPFKSLKRPEVYKFRRYIETQNLSAVEALVWENPRYLIGIGDTPTIMQEGPRYNALHIAAMYNSSKEAEFILKTVSSKFFIQLLYGAAGDSSYVVRPEVMIEMYLNTPDKALNETPLHFAAKYGSLEVVKLFTQYPQLQLCLKNKHGQTPKDITCKSFRAKITDKTSDARNIAWYTREIHKLLDEPFFVPIWRSNEDVVQPIIGKPFSPKSPPVCPLATSPLSPVMEIKAVAGPMSYNEATNFHKTWRSPVKISNCGTPHITKGILLRSPLGCEKSFERVGRTLARQFHVSWKEYWPFLDKFTDLASEEGLNLLEEYLRNIISCSTHEVEATRLIINSPMSDLCSAFSKFSIKSPNGVDSHSTTPYLCVDNMCSTFANSVVNAFKEHFQAGVPVEENIAVLIKRIRNLSATINTFSGDKTFRNFPFDKIHARVAFWIVSNISQANDSWLRYVTSIFHLIHATEGIDITHCISVSPSSSSLVELNRMVQTLKCINENVMKVLRTEVICEDGPECNKDWWSMNSCPCFDRNNNNRYGENFPYADGNKSPCLKIRDAKCRARKRISFPDEDDEAESPSTALGVRRLENIAQVTNTKYDCDSFVKGPPDGTKHSDDSEDEFFTPPNSVCDSEDEMECPDEGPNLFIYDNRGTSMDNSVLEAIADVYISSDQYPSIYRWKHSILLNNNLNRFSWPSPSIVKQKKIFR